MLISSTLTVLILSLPTTSEAGPAETSAAPMSDALRAPSGAVEDFASRRVVFAEPIAPALEALARVRPSSEPDPVGLGILRAARPRPLGADGRPVRSALARAPHEATEPDLSGLRLTAR